VPEELRWESKEGEREDAEGTGEGKAVEDDPLDEERAEAAEPARGE
jgi:hypothetical protein